MQVGAYPPATTASRPEAPPSLRSRTLRLSGNLNENAVMLTRIAAQLGCDFPPCETKSNPREPGSSLDASLEHAERSEGELRAMIQIINCKLGET